MPEGLPEGTATVLFTDVEGSTSLATSQGDEAGRDVLRAQPHLLRRQIEEHSGHEVMSLRDGSMVAFTSARRATPDRAGIQYAKTNDGVSIAY